MLSTSHLNTDVYQRSVSTQAVYQTALERMERVNTIIDQTSGFTSTPASVDPELSDDATLCLIREGEYDVGYVCTKSLYVIHHGKGCQLLYAFARTLPKLPYKELSERLYLKQLLHLTFQHGPSCYLIGQLNEAKNKYRSSCNDDQNLQTLFGRAVDHWQLHTVNKHHRVDLNAQLFGFLGTPITATQLSPNTQTSSTTGICIPLGLLPFSRCLLHAWFQHIAVGHTRNSSYAP